MLTKALGKSTLLKLMPKSYDRKKLFYPTHESPLDKRTNVALRLQENPYIITTCIHTYIHTTSSYD